MSRVLFSFSLLEGEADGENAVVIVDVEVGGGNLESATDSEGQAMPKMESADYQTWGHEHLGLAVVRAILKIRVVHFDFRPELPIQVILEGIVPRIRVTNLGFIACGESHTERALNVEMSKMPLRVPSTVTAFALGIAALAPRAKVP